jgi:ornithine decarboxylase
MNKAKVALVKSSLDEIITNKINSRADCETEDKNDAFFIGDMGDVVRKQKLWTSQLPRVEPFYAVKCNDDSTVLAVLAELGTGFDCASKGELQKVLELQVPTSRIIYANPCKQSSHIKFAAANNVEFMTFDNETELHKIKTLHPGAKMVVRILPPANTKCQCQLGMKFGCHPKKVPHLLRVAKQLDVEVVGVSFHVGSGCYDAMAYYAAVASARTIFNIASLEGFHFNLLDIGGGFPGQPNAKLPFEEICNVLRPALDMYFPENMNVRIIAEPGRFFVASAFTLVLNVIARRAITSEDYNLDNDDSENALASTDENSEATTTTNANDDKAPTTDSAAKDDAVNESEEANTAAGTTAGTADKESDSMDTMYMYYVNDGVYGSFNCILFDHATVKPILFDEERFENDPRFKSSLWGPTCDGLDCIIKECLLPELNTGDWILFNDMGAYTMSAASNFNGMPKPKCYHIMNETHWFSLCRQSGRSVELQQANKPCQDTSSAAPCTTSEPEETAAAVHAVEA